MCTMMKNVYVLHVKLGNDLQQQVARRHQAKFCKVSCHPTNMFQAAPVSDSNEDKDAEALQHAVGGAQYIYSL